MRLHIIFDPFIQTLNSKIRILSCPGLIIGANQVHTSDKSQKISCQISCKQIGKKARKTILLTISPQKGSNFLV